MASLAFIQSSALIDLVKSADPKGNMQVRVLTATQLAIGADPLNPTSIIDFSKEAVRPFKLIAGKEPEPPVEGGHARTAQKASRQTGRYLLDFKGITTECRSLKEMLAQGLMALEAHQRGVLQKLSAIKPRTKRIVAREPSQLFDQTELSDKYAEQLMAGWWYGTNNSADETRTWLQRGAEIAGLEWGKDISISI